MKLRNLIFALFLVIGAIGFVSCTGDDGATGPAGPAGPKGDKGDTGDAGDSGGPGSTTGTYDFLKTWGDADGEVTCNDFPIEGTAVFPGDDVELTALGPAPATGNFLATAAINANVVVACDTSLFGAASYTDKAGDPATGAANSLIFEKTHRAEPDPVMTQVEATQFERAHVLTTTHKFASGPFHANMPNSGSDEGLERAILDTQCSVGTSPPALAGTWKAVEITEAKVYYVNGVALDTGNPADSITRKVCLSLNSTPGAVKCFVDKPDVGTNAMLSIGIYAPDGTLHPIMTPTTRALDSTTTADAQFIAPAAEILGANLCRLFEGGAP